MPLRVTRRPYTDCPYRWSLTVADINTAEGIVSESQCTDLNGDFSLDFAPCLSKGGNLNWVGECEGGGSSGDCAMPFCTVGPSSVAIAGMTIDLTTAGATFDEISPIPETLSFNSRWYRETLCCSWTGEASWIVTTTDKTPFPYSDSASRDLWTDNGDGTFSIHLYETFLFHWPFFYSDGGGLGNEVELVVIRTYGNGTVRNSYGEPEAVYASSLLSACQDSFSLNKRVSANTSLSPCEVSPDLVAPPFPFTFAAGPLTATAVASDGTTGPAAGDRIRSKWHLSYNIAETLWTLRSFNRIDYPIYTLVDSTPCVGETKTLVLSDRGMLADGCGVAPAEVTITRACPPDREANSGLLEDRRINGATGKKKRQCSACDCQDEVDDTRYGCGTKCTDNTTPGCESYTDEEAPCLYPKTTVCCDYCDGMDQPCAYIVEFECDIPSIAAKQVTLRQECPFDNTCDWVAVGPSSNPEDGGVGAQPVCSTCSGTCPETGCTWQSWSAGACP